jgi:hypothetical protein
VRNIHFSIEEKAEIIVKELSVDPQYSRPAARKIAEAIDMFTFNDLDELVRAIKKIARGND